MRRTFGKLCLRNCKENPSVPSLLCNRASLSPGLDSCSPPLRGKPPHRQQRAWQDLVGKAAIWWPKGGDHGLGKRGFGERCRQHLKWGPRGTRLPSCLSIQRGAWVCAWQSRAVFINSAPLPASRIVSFHLGAGGGEEPGARPWQNTWFLVQPIQIPTPRSYRSFLPSLIRSGPGKDHPSSALSALFSLFSDSTLSTHFYAFIRTPSTNLTTHEQREMA